MLRAAALLLMAVLVAFPMAVLPSPPVTWLVVVALVVGSAGVVALSVPLVTAGASVVLIAYALALAIARPAVHGLAATACGVTFVLLLALVHFAGRVQGATIGAAVIASQLRQWLAIGAVGVVAAGVLMVGGTALGPVIGGASLPVVVVGAALGALLTAAGVIALVTRRDAPSSATGR